MTVQAWQQRFENWLQQHHDDDDAAHDISHFRRVWATAQRLSDEENADPLVILTACYFHDIVSLPKNDPQRSRSSVWASEKTVSILRNDFPDFPEHLYPAVAHAIEAHSHSANIAPETREAKIVQDADRLESLGAIGLARVFSVAGRLNVSLFDAQDPFADSRALNDQRYALDHFQNKLLRLHATMQTEQGKALAEHNARYLVQFMAKISAELQGDYLEYDEAILARFEPRV